MPGSGVIAIAGGKGYFNGSSDVTGLGALAVSTYPPFIAAINNVGSAAGFLQFDVQAISFYDIDVSSYITNLTNAMNAL